VRQARLLRREVLAAQQAHTTASEAQATSASEALLQTPEIILSASPTTTPTRRSARRVSSIHDFLRPGAERAGTDGQLARRERARSTSAEDNERLSGSATPQATSEDGAAGRPSEAAVGEASSTPPKRKHSWRSKKIRRLKSA
jgi:hypothetical protein